MISKTLKSFLFFVRKLLGVNLILNKLEAMEFGLSTILTPDSLPLGVKLEILPGSVYAKVAIPLDYRPSRSYEPRWGYSKEKINSLNDWLQNYEGEYSKFVSRMFEQDVSSISVDYNPEESSKHAFVGGAICAFDSLSIYTMLLVHKPRIYCEIGSGMTTLFAKQSIIDNALKTRIISIDPEPRQFVDNVCDEIIREPLESLDPAWFDQLNAGDILFMDGSHRSFMNSDVTVFFIDILPRIKPGVVIHIHDINLPYDYPDSFKEWYWNEQYLLAVYLMASMEKVIPLLPTTFICRSEKLKALISENFVSLGSAERDESWFGGGSFWFTKK